MRLALPTVLSRSVSLTDVAFLPEAVLLSLVVTVVVIVALALAGIFLCSRLLEEETGSSSI